ncbi:hypothetical protein V8E54_005893 [Elaphomyces granulatus]
MTISQQPQASDVDDVDFPLPPTRKRKEIRLSDKGGQQPRASKNQLSSARSTTSLPSTIATFTETPVHSEQEESGRVKKQKHNPHPNMTYYDMEELPLLKKVQKSYARHYLTKFSNKGVIELFWANSQSPQKDWEIAEARHGCLETAKAWKCKALKSMKRSNLRSTIQQWIAPWDSEGSPRYRRIFLKGLQAGEIHPSLLLHEGISGCSGAYDIYANLATQVKLYLDISKKKPQEEAGAWLEILEFWDQMASDRAAGELTKARAEYFGTRPEKKRETVKRPRKSLNGRIFLSEEMPPLPV